MKTNSLVKDIRRKKDDEFSNSKIPRPLYIRDFIGQKSVVQNLVIFIQSTKKRNEPLDHVLLSGPPGLGKTTLARIISQEMTANFRSTSGPILSKIGDLAAVLTGLNANDVLFIDEVHRLHPAVEELLYSAMEDFKLDIIVGEGPGARSMRLSLAPFTLIGATTRVGLLSTPLKDRFLIPLRFDFYDLESLRDIVVNNAQKMNINISVEAASEIAKRSRGTPRISIRLLRRVWDFVCVGGGYDNNNNSIEINMTMHALDQLCIDRCGLDLFDHRYLMVLVETFNGGPVGIETIAAILNEPRDSLEDFIEPYLMQLGFLYKTPRGRMIADHVFEYLGISKKDINNK